VQERGNRKIGGIDQPVTGGGERRIRADHLRHMRHAFSCAFVIGRHKGQCASLAVRTHHHVMAQQPDVHDPVAAVKFAVDLIGHTVGKLPVLWIEVGRTEDRHQKGQQQQRPAEQRTGAANGGIVTVFVIIEVFVDLFLKHLAHQKPDCNHEPDKQRDHDMLVDRNL